MKIESIFEEMERRILKKHENSLHSKKPWQPCLGKARKFVFFHNCLPFLNHHQGKISGGCFSIKAFSSFS